MYKVFKPSYVRTKVILTYLACIACCCSAYSQGKISSVKGTITDSVSGEILEQASVSLTRLADFIEVKQVHTGRNGFEFRQVTIGNYWITVSFIGYRTDTLTLYLDKADSTYNIGKIKLVKLPVNLVEVVVKAVIPPVIVRNDTLIFNANAFKTQPNATIEDLLKKLPGIAVDRNGNVSIQGKKVEKVYIDGKEFFLSDPKIATRNLTADMVDAIEAFDNQSERARFTGIKESNVNKAINLRLKKDRKKGLFGNMTASAGTQNSYSGTATATYFKGDRWIFTNFNTSYADNLASGAGQIQSAGNQALNYRDNAGSKTLLIVNYGGGNNRNKSGQSYNRETFLGDSSLLQNRKAFTDNSSGNYEMNGNFTYNIDSFNSIIYTPALSFRKNDMMNSDSSSIITQKENGNYLGNAGKTMNGISSRGFALSNAVTFRRRFKQNGRTLHVVMRQNTQQQKQEGQIYTSVKFHTNNGSIIQDYVVDQEYDQINHGANWGLNIAYTEPIRSNQIIDIGYNLNTSSNSSDKKAFNYNPATGNYDIPDTLTTNQFTNSHEQQTFNIGYNYIGESVQYQLGVSMLYSSLKNKGESHRYISIDQHLLNWSPRASAFLKLTQQKNIQLQYNGSSAVPTTEMLQPIPDLSNPFLITLGNPNLKQQFQHSIEVNYISSNSSTFSNLSLQLGGDYTVNKIVQSSAIIAGGIQQLQYVNINGAYTINGNLSYGFPLNKTPNGNGQLSTLLQYSRDISPVNGMQNVRQTLIWGQGFNLNYHTKEKLYAGLSASVNYSRSNYSIGSDLNTKLFLHNYSMNVTYVLPFSIRVSSDLAVQINGKQGNLPGRTITSWNASVFRNIFRNSKGEISLSAFDLLNRNAGFNRSASGNYIETRESNVVRRYFILNLRYNFRTELK